MKIHANGLTLAIVHFIKAQSLKKVITGNMMIDKLMLYHAYYAGSVSELL